MTHFHLSTYYYRYFLYSNPFANNIRKIIISQILNSNTYIIFIVKYKKDQFSNYLTMIITLITAYSYWTMNICIYSPSHYFNCHAREIIKYYVFKTYVMRKIEV